MNASSSTLVLNAEQIRQKIRRIAFQVYENNFEETALLFAGISGEGYVLAQALARELQAIAPFSVRIIELTFDKSQSIQPRIEPELPDLDYSQTVVIIVDDVLYTGRTLAFSLQPFLNVPVRKVQVAVLIDRNHPRYPVAADYKGYELSTTLTEHIEVKLSDEGLMGVYMT